MQACFVNSKDPPISEQHICYYVKERNKDELDLYEVVLQSYPHPDAPNDAVVLLMNEHIVKTVNKTDYRASDLILLQASQKTTKRLHYGSSN